MDLFKNIIEDLEGCFIEREIDRDFELIGNILELKKTDKKQIIAGFLRYFIEEKKEINRSILNILLEMKADKEIISVMLDKTNNESYLENDILKYFKIYFPRYILIGNQVIMNDKKDILDILAEDETGRKVIIEIKRYKNKINNQLLRYSKNFENPILLAVNSNDIKIDCIKYVDIIKTISESIKELDDCIFENMGEELATLCYSKDKKLIEDFNENLKEDILILKHLNKKINSKKTYKEIIKEIEIAKMVFSSKYNQ